MPKKRIAQMENAFAYEFPEEPHVSSAIQSDNLSSSTSPPNVRDINYHPELKLNNRSMPRDGVTVTKDLSRMINNIIIQEPTYYKSKCAPSSHEYNLSHIDNPSLNYHNSTLLTHSNVPKVKVDERDYVYSPEEYFEPESAPSHYHCQKRYSDISTTVLHSMADGGGGGSDGLMIDQDEDSWNSSLEPFSRDRCNTWPLPKPAYLDPNVASQSTVQKGALISKQTPPVFGSLAPFSIKEEIEEECDEATKPTKSDSFVNHSAAYKYLPHSDKILTSFAPGEWADTYDESYDLKLLNCANQNSLRHGEVDTIQPLPELTPDDILLDDQQLHHANTQGSENKYDPMTYLNQNNSALNPFTRSPITQNSNLSNTDILRFISTTTTYSSSTSRKNAWGNYSYADLITKAIQTSADKRLTLSQIYDWMVQYIPYFKDKGDSNSSAGWKNSIRHNLSLHNRFIRLQNEGAGKSSWWMINPDAKPGKTARRRAATLDPKAYEKKKGRVRKRISQNISLSSICDPTYSGGYYTNSSSISSLKQVGAPSNLNAHPNAFKPFAYNIPVENGDNKLYPYAYTCGLMSEPRESHFYNLERSQNSTLLKPFTNHYNNRSILSDSSPLTFSSSRNSLSPLSGKGSKELLYHQSPTNHSSDYTETDYGTCNRSSSYLATPMDYANLPEFRNRAISCVATFSDNNLTRKKHYANHLDNFCEPDILKQKSNYKSQQVKVITEDSHPYRMVTNLDTNFSPYPHYNGNDRATSSLNEPGLQDVPSIPYNYSPQTVLQCDDENRTMDWSAKPIYTPVSDKHDSSKINVNTDYTCEQWQTDNRFSNYNESNSYQRSMVSQLPNSRDVEINYKGEQIQKPQRYHPTENYYFNDEPLNNDEEPVVETASKVYLDLSELRQRDCGFKHSVPSNPVYFNQCSKTCQDPTNNFLNPTHQIPDHNMAPEVDSMLGSNSVSSSRLNLTPPALGSTPPSQHEFSLLRQTLNKPYNQTSGNRIYQGISSISDMETRDYNDMTRSTKNGHEIDRNLYWSDKSHSACQCDKDVSFNGYYLQSQSHDHDFKPYSPCREQVNHKESNRAFSPFSMARTVSSNALVNVDFNYNESSSSFN